MTVDVGVTTTDPLTWILQADTAFTAVCYAAWGASATVMGLEIERERRGGNLKGMKVMEF